MPLDPFAPMLTHDQLYGTTDAVVVLPSADPDPVEDESLGAVLDEVVAWLDRFMAMSPEQLDACALFVAHTYAVEHFQVVAYLFVTSAEKRCGKTLLLDLLEQLVLRGRSTTNISPAALYRMIDAQHPTLLIDEVDTIFASKGKNGDPAKSDLIGLINAGFRRGRPTYRMGGQNMRELEAFDPFGPKVLAGIGRCLPDTTEDRSVPIVIPRKARNATKDRYRVRIHEQQGKELAERIAAAVAMLDLSDRWPALPDKLNDRQQDIWEPLLTMADAAGGDWSDRARRAAVELHQQTDPSESLGATLLADIRTVFTVVDTDNRPMNTVEKMLTKQLVQALNNLDESPWGGFRRDQGLSSVQLVNLLRPFGIKSKPLRVGADRGKGFELEQFTDTFDRYLTDDTDDTDDNNPSQQVNPVTTSADGTDDAGDDSAVIGHVITPPAPADDAPDLGLPPDVTTVTTVIADVPEGFDATIPAPATDATPSGGDAA